MINTVRRSTLAIDASIRSLMQLKEPWLTSKSRRYLCCIQSLTTRRSNGLAKELTALSVSQSTLQKSQSLASNTQYLYLLDADKARDRKTGEVVALKKLRMDRERDGMCMAFCINCYLPDTIMCTATI